MGSSEDEITEWVRAFLNARYYKVSYRTDMIFEIAVLVRAKLEEESRRKSP